MDDMFMLMAAIGFFIMIGVGLNWVAESVYWRYIDWKAKRGE